MISFYFSMSPFRLLLTITFLFLFVNTTFADRVREGTESIQTTISGNAYSHASVYKNIKVKKWVPNKPKKPTLRVPNPTINRDTQSWSITKSISVSYQTPDGSASIGFSVTMKDGIIIAASSTTQARGTSAYYQDSFAQSVAKSVVGKKASTLSLSAIGGASLTTNAFTQYIVNL